MWRSLFADGLPLSALHVRPNSDDHVGEIVHMLRQLILGVMPETQLRRLWMFIAHSPWQENNRIVNYRKIWRDIGFQSLNWPETHRGPEVMVASKKGVRYAAVGLVDAINLGIAVDVCLAGPFSTFMLVSDQDFTSVDATLALFDVTFPSDRHGIPETTEDWGALIHQRAKHYDVVIKRARGFDGFESCLDMFGRTEVLEAFVHRVPEEFAGAQLSIRPKR